ncbi:MAG: hypothetical protein ACREMY_08465 [bacterium]
MSAQADQVDVDQSASWDNSVDVDLSWDVDVTKFLNIDGSISITGSVDADALAQATLDDKQILDRNEVQFEDYQNAYQDNSNERIGAEPGLGQLNNLAPNFTEEGSPHGPALYTNTVSAGANTLQNASGNIGLNMAAGDYNLQENAAVISSATGLNGTSGAAEAGSFSLQNLYDNGFNDESFELENTNIDNTVNIGPGLGNGATGNIGVNGAAGAFNIQKNALVIATVRVGNLAEATAGTMQDAEFNDSYVEDTVNNVTVGSSLIGASGNIGVNLAAGVGNLQLNSLTIANALAAIVNNPPATSGGGGITTTGG